MRAGVIRAAKSEVLFLSALLIWNFLNFFGNSEILIDHLFAKNILGHGLKIIIFCLLLFKIASDRYSPKRLLIYTALGFMVLLSYYLCGGEDVVWLLLFSMSTRNVNFDKIVKTMTISYICLLIMVVMLALIGLIPNNTTVGTNILTGTVTVRRLLGFKHVNFLGGFVFTTFVGYLYLRYEHFSIIDWIFSISTAMFLLFYVCSRTSAVLVFLAMLLTMIYKWFTNNTISAKILRICTYAGMAVCVIASVLLCVNYDKLGTIGYIIDEILTHRVKWGFSFYNNYGFSLFGQEITLISSTQAIASGGSSAILDNAYMHLLIRYGIVLSAILMLIYYKLVGYAFKLKKHKIALIVLIYFVCGITEKWLLMLPYNYVLTAFIPLLDIIKEQEMEGRTDYARLI